MKQSKILYSELIKIADKVGFEVRYKFANYTILARELGDFMNNDNREVVKDHTYYRELFKESPYTAYYKERG